MARHENSKHRISVHLSPAVKATERVMSERHEKRGSIDSNMSEPSAVEVERQSVAPITRWTTANRTG